MLQQKMWMTIISDYHNCSVRECSGGNNRVSRQKNQCRNGNV